MKIFIGILIILAVYLYNNATANYIFNIFYYQNHSHLESIVKKDIKTLKDINHSFKVKLSPNYYELNLNMKYDYLTTSWHKIKPSIGKTAHKLISKVIIKNSKNNVIYEKTIEIKGGSGGLYYDRIFELHNFIIDYSDTYTISVELIDTNIKDVPKDLLFFDLIFDIST